MASRIVWSVKEATLDNEALCYEQKINMHIYMYKFQRMDAASCKISDASVVHKGS